MIEDDEMDKAVAEANQEVATSSTLLTHARTLARADQDLRDRARREQLRIMRDYRDRVTAIDNDHEHECSEALAALDHKHRLALDAAEDQMRLELAEHEMLSVRLERLR